VAPWGPKSAISDAQGASFQKEAGGRVATVGFGHEALQGLERGEPDKGADPSP